VVLVLLAVDKEVGLNVALDIVEDVVKDADKEEMDAELAESVTDVLLLGVDVNEDDEELKFLHMSSNESLVKLWSSKPHRGIAKVVVQMSVDVSKF